MKSSKQTEIRIGLIVLGASGTAMFGWWVTDSVVWATAVFISIIALAAWSQLQLEQQAQPQMRTVPVRSELPTVPNKHGSVYEAPAIIHEGEITTRAGSPTGLDPNGIDPSDLFDN